MGHYLVIVLRPIVPIVSRKSVPICHWLKRVRWIPFELSQMVEKVILLCCRRSIGRHNKIRSRRLI